ncbi:MAG: bifunctional adenosylcobinamide kinase/adenosylcobinamide-phosphate guanylyltransferase [Syntrophomonadaceae bacterium]
MMQSQAKLIFITGGVRSGKSSYAQKIADSAGGKVYYIATLIPGDEEMQARVVEHQKRRPDSWITIEEDCNPARVIKAYDQIGAVFLIDCLTMLVNNLMFSGESPPGEESILNQIEDLAETSSASEATVIIVSNEVGGGIVPADPLSRAYRDALGRANQIVSRRADEVYLCVAGQALELKSRNASLQIKDKEGK